MKTRAAVLVELGRPLEIADLEIPPLQPGQVLVQIAYSGVCHTQLLEARGQRGEDPFLPHCLGHEACAVVLECGANVRKCKPGDQVILSWIKGSGENVPGAQYEWGQRKVNAGGVTTFMERAVVSENRLTLLPSGLDMRRAALLGCAAPTGVGSVWNAAQVETGDRVAVFGVGGVGLCAVAAAVAAGASEVFAVDVQPSRLRLAAELGAHHLCDANNCDPVAEIRDATSGGVDQAIEASGRPQVMSQALQAVRPQGGRAVVIGNARFGETLELDPMQLNQGKKLLGVWGGDCQPDRDLPKIAAQMEQGSLRLDLLIGDEYALDDVNQALQDLANASVARPLLRLSAD